MRPPGLRRRRRFHAGLALLAIAVAAGASTAASGDAVPGSAGTDTALAATSSQVTAQGRGRFGALAVTVNQTKNLANQAISVTWTGATPTITGPGRFAGHYLQLMQCWGDDDGTVPGNPGPPPEQCVLGATDAVYGGRNSGVFPGGGFALERIISKQGFEDFDPADGFLEARTGYLWRPFRAVDGTVVNSHYDPAFNPAIEGGSFWLNPFFNSITTNEISGGRTGPNGTGSELFTVETGLEATGLGCGQSVQPVAGGSLAAPKCWLVIVPRGSPEEENLGTPFGVQSGVVTSPLSPSAWANRIAIPLEFNPLDSSCDLADEQRQVAGSELVSVAVSSWQPKLCASPGLPPYSYGKLGDENARQQLLSGVPGGPGMVVVSDAVDPTLVRADNPVVYAPLSVSATVIGFNIERNPKPDAPPAEQDLQGVRVAQLNLTPRLVAKLLTQSYRSQIEIKSNPGYDWLKGNPIHLGLDPDFRQFNPEFDLLQTATAKNLGGFVLPVQGSDAARQLWAWVLSDPEAKTWLDGGPDQFGMRVNPVYATRAAANSTGAAFGEPIPDAYPKSDPYCYQAPSQGTGGSVVPPALCGLDWLPYAQSLRDSARFIRAADDGARTSEDPFANSADKVYRKDGPQILGTRSILGVTDSASAFQYGVQSARLSRAGDDGSDRRFIAPDEAAMAAAVAAMVPTPGVPQVLRSDPKTAAPAAYPLTALTYGAVTPLSLDGTARNQYAAFVDYATGPGQVPGLEIGQLPTGYTPLSPALQAQAAAAARTIRELALAAAPVDESSPSLSGDFGSTGPVDSFSGSGEDFADGVTPPPVTPVAAPEAKVGLGVATPILALASNRFALPVLAVIALLSCLGVLEITKRPRRAERSEGDQ